MSSYLFPDPLVLRGFVVAGRLDTLKSLLDGRGRWTAATAFETERRLDTRSAVESVLAEGWMGEPLEISEPEEIRRVHFLRRAVFGGAPGDPLSRLAAAETWHVLREWPAFSEGILVTDDPLLLHFAGRQGVRAQRASLSLPC